MASSSHQEELHEQGQEDEEDQHGDQITAPLLQPSSSPEEGEQWGEAENSSVEQVALTVPVGDDPSTPVLTFRMWVLGATACVALSFLNTFFGYRKEPLEITAISAQVGVVPLGRLMAAALPERAFFRGRRWEFTLNPGPFNVKEHVLITIFANAGAGSVFAINLVTALRVFYGKPISFLVSLLVVLTSQVLGFGWAGIFRRYLVEPAAMWWPSNLVQVSLFSAGANYTRQNQKGVQLSQVNNKTADQPPCLGTAWWMMDTIPNMCNTELLPAGSPWTCPYDHLFYDASVIWGLISPRRIFGDLGTYSAVNWFFLGGAIAPLLVWLAHKAFPGQKWILLVNMPVLLGGISHMPPATAVNYTAWICVAFLSGYVVYKYRHNWWKRHNYLLSGALDAGLAFMAVLIYLCLELGNITLNWWGNVSDGCPLASCPTAKGIVVNGCPVHN